jgi:hypothetical protein
VIEYLRLAFGTILVLAPGAAVARALGRRSAASLLAWSMAALFVAWTVVFTVHGSIVLAAVVLAVVLAVAVIVPILRPRRRRRSRREPALAGSPWPWLVGLVLGWSLWHVAGAVTGDGLFHEARVRKLVELGNLHLRTVDEFKDGGLHPGYAFPLWHGFLALVSWVSGVDPAEVIRHEPSVLAPLACALAWEAGVAVFGSRWAGVSVLVAVLGMFVFGPGHGGSYAQLAQPATVARQLLVPAVVTLFFVTSSWQARAELAAVFGALALVHPTYALFILVPLAGYVLLQPRAWREWAPSFAAAVVPVGLALLWLRPIVDETVSHDPGAGERARAIRQYADQLVVTNEHHYRLAAEVFGRSGAVAVAALFLLPVTALAWPRRWVAFVLGGTLLVIVLLEVPWLFVQLSNGVSLSQSRRAAGFAPLAFALAGAFALLARTALVVPLALVGGVVVEHLWPGDFAYGLRHGGPALATWIALFGGGAALVIAIVARRRPAAEYHRLGAVAMVAFVLPIAVHGARRWTPQFPTDPGALSPRLVHALRTTVPKGAVVLAPVQASYRVVADAPVYVVALPPTHVADTRANAPYARVRAVDHWVATGDPQVAHRYGATWAIRGGRLYRLPR